MSEYIEQGEKFLNECVFNGLAHSYDVVKDTWVKPYPEVTGYVLSYFCDNHLSLTPNLIEAANMLVKLQEPVTGGYRTFYEHDNLYAFDTAQICIGLLCMYEQLGDRSYLNAALKAGTFLKIMQNEDGSIAPLYNITQQRKISNPPIYAPWNGPLSGLMCKLTECFKKLHDVTKDDGWHKCMIKTADFYEHADYIECTHPLGYWLEGLLAAGRVDKVRDVLKKVLPRIRANGFIPYTEKLDYAYVSGTMQLGIILWKTGYYDEARRILEYGRLVQDSSDNGGLFQFADSEGHLDNHVHTEQNSWGTKYFCQLERLVMKSEPYNYENYLKQWFGSIDEEIKYWDFFCRQGKEVYKDMWDKHVENNKALSYITEYFDAFPDGCEVKYIDVGSGPFSRNGIISKRLVLKTEAVDPLAAVYNSLKDKYNLNNGIKIQTGFVELLDKEISANKYDIVHMSNALDHCFDPILGIYQLLRICKIGGMVLLRHNENEAERQNYTGLHQWNLSLDHQKNAFIIWNKNYRYNINKIFSKVADVITKENVVEKESGWIHNEVILRKKRDVSLPENNYYEIFARTIFEYFLMNSFYSFIRE